MSGIDEEVKQKIIDAYLEASPTPENSMDIVNDLAEEYERSPNSIRMLLSNAQVYVKKTSVKTTTKTSSDTSEKATRKSKQSSLDELTSAIQELGKDVNEEIISKLTGKAADYFTSILTSIK